MPHVLLLLLLFRHTQNFPLICWLIIEILEYLRHGSITLASLIFPLKGTTTQQSRNYKQRTQPSPSDAAALKIIHSPAKHFRGIITSLHPQTLRWRSPDRLLIFLIDAVLRLFSLDRNWRNPKNLPRRTGKAKEKEFPPLKLWQEPCAAVSCRLSINFAPFLALEQPPPTTGLIGGSFDSPIENWRKRAKNSSPKSST